MNGNCLDLGTIQAFLDGETRPEEAIRISDHVADCDTCTLMLAQAEEESSLVFSVLDRELNTLVPTQRLWTRINDSIAEEKSRTSIWQRLGAFVSTSLMSPSFAGAAGLLMVVTLGALIWSLNPGSEPAGPSMASNAGVQTFPVQPPPVEVPAPPQVINASTDDKKASRVDESKLSDDQVRRIINANFVERGPKKVNAVPASARYLPGEESYIRTINDLEQSVTAQNASLSASSQVSYATDIAIVDDSIKKMREVVKKNPRNQAARQVLYSTYQDKIDLLKAASGSSELMATLQYQ